MLLLIEFVLSALIVPLALIAPRFGNRFVAAIEKRISRFAARRGLAVLAVFILALGARIAVLPVEPIPHPGVHDEFSYLLMADTFAHGRLTNPTHPMWQHFETFHVNQIPTYGSMYYPAQGLFLAFGQIVLGHPFWGFWLSTGLMCAAFCWALQGWMPPAWAFLGGILAIIRLGTFSYWANSYWGGSIAAIGGALVLGALPRIRRHRRIRDAVVMAAGLAILGNSRPYESVFYTLPILVAMALAFIKSEDVRRGQYRRRVLLPGGAIVLLTLVGMAYYFKQCTGSPLVPPYLVNVRTYETAPLFPWQKLNDQITYRHPSMARFELGWPVQEYESARHDPIAHLLVRGLKGGLFFGGPLLMLPWLVLGVILPYGMSIRQLGCKNQLLLIVIASTAVGIALPVYFDSHYAAPACCALYALEIQALRRIYVHDRHGRAIGKAIVPLFILTCFCLLGVKVAMNGLNIPSASGWFIDWETGGTRDIGREPISTQLNRMPGSHLVIVSYSANHDMNSEWIYNGADIDNSKIVWARDIGPEQNGELIRYFNSRKVWLAEPDKTPPQIAEYDVRETK